MMRKMLLLKLFVLPAAVGFPGLQLYSTRLGARGLATSLSNSLEVKNAHPLDDCILFNEHKHEYEVNGQPAAYSVTSAISRFFTPFNADAAIASMMSKKDWPRPEYIGSNGAALSVDEIKRIWEATRVGASSSGTSLHTEIETYINRFSGLSNKQQLNDAVTTSPELQQFIDFFRSRIIAEDIAPFRTEWRIAVRDGSLAGCIDFVGRRSDGTFVIGDWKRSRKFHEWQSSYGKKCRPPLQHMPQCDASKYALQVNLYRYILEKYYGMTVSSMFVASFHSDLSSAGVMVVPRCDKEIHSMLASLHIDNL